MLTKLLAAIMAVESGGNIKAIGDNGRSIGPYQIQMSYWKDSGVGGVYLQCFEKSYSERVIRAYWRWYAGAAYRRLQSGEGTIKDCEQLARIHNGGPAGWRKAATYKYWKKVKFQLQRICNHEIQKKARYR